MTLNIFGYSPLKSLHICFERVLFELLGEVSGEHLFPFLFGDQAFAQFFLYFGLVLAHVLPDEDEALFSLADVSSLGLLFQSQSCVGGNSSPWDSAIDVELDGGLTPLKEGVGVIGEPDEALRSKGVLEGALIL